MMIRMYNCYFGDCFNIENLNENNLLVDCGIHSICQNINVRNQRFKDIYCDINNSTMDFLLSHYHEDHYNGIEYMSNKWNYKFEKVYIPDIWDINGSIDAISLHLLSGILDKSILHKGTTILTFLKALCKDDGKVIFVRRGSKIQDKYVALWPSEKFIKDKADKLLKKMIVDEDLSDNDISQLSYYSTELQTIVLGIRSNNIERSGLLERINLLEEDISKSFEHFIDKGVKPSTLFNLKDFGNNISIVFQNNEDTANDNILFTGDFGSLKKQWNKIECNFDGKKDCKMHPLYHVIKIGHHGTRAYYHSFVGRINNDSVLLIPNDGGKKGWNICSDYSLNALSTGAQVICATNNTCEAKNNNRGCCSCTNCAIIEPNIYFDVI